MKYDGFLLMFCRFFITFALMKRDTKRQFAAWAFLVLFLPMLVLSSVHIHPAVDYSDTLCAECIHHQHHHSHLLSATASIHDCILCQVFHLTFLIAISLLILYTPRKFNHLPLGHISLHRSYAKRPDIPRAPPFS